MYEVHALGYLIGLLGVNGKLLFRLDACIIHAKIRSQLAVARMVRVGQWWR